MRATGFLPGCLLLCLIATGCLDTARIKRAPLNPTAQDSQKTDVPGLPFYIKVAKCKQETSWLQPYYALTLKKTITTKFASDDAAKDKDDACKKCRVSQPKACAANDPDNDDNCKKCIALEPAICREAPTLPQPVVNIRSQVVGLDTFQQKDVQDLRGLVSGKIAADGSLETAIEGTWTKIAAVPIYSPFGQSEDDLVKTKNVVEIANKSYPDAVVDYSRTYYYNSPRPWIGTSSLDVHLNTDGTLAEGNSSVTSQTLQAFLSALPISALITKAAGLAAEAAPGAYSTKQTVEYELSIQPSAYTHTHSRYVDFSVPCPVDPVGVIQQPYTLSVDSSPAPATTADANKPAPSPAPATSTAAKP